LITEKHFTLSHSAFWHHLLPMSEHCVRQANLFASRFSEPYESILPASQRGIINEIAFQLFLKGSVNPKTTSHLSGSEEDLCVRNALLHISTLRQFSRHPPKPPDSKGMEEAHNLAERLNIFFETLSPKRVLGSPAFSGCGLVERCFGDVICDSVLFEIKAGDRGFRSSDFRQLLCYWALNYASKNYEITEVCLLNPRLGLYVRTELEQLSRQLSGRTSMEVLADIVEYISEPSNRYNHA
jgi:hypothetical protein